MERGENRALQAGSPAGRNRSGLHSMAGRPSPSAVLPSFIAIRALAFVRCMERSELLGSCDFCRQRGAQCAAAARGFIHLQLHLLNAKVTARSVTGGLSAA